jgi:DNA-binding PadR family transcriptional regulator
MSRAVSVYPDFYSAASTRGLKRQQVRTEAVEAAMIRHHYGPWDKRYYHVLAYLEARKLITIVIAGRTRRIALTALGKTTARKLLANEAFRDLVVHMRNVNGTLGRKNGNELKTMIYDLFGEEIAEQPLGRVIGGIQK